MGEIRSQTETPIIFFDGICGLCNGFVDFVMAVDKKHVFKFATLQGEKAKATLSAQDYENLDSIVLFVDGKVLRKSEAVFEVLKRIGGVWSLAAVGSILPATLTNVFYDLTAKYRYMIFGKKESCRIPTKAERALFFD